MSRNLTSWPASALLSISLACSTANANVTPGTWSPKGAQAGAQFGAAVTPVGDVNNDGYGDVLVGAPGHDNGQTDEGRVLLYLGSASGLSVTPSWIWESNQVGAEAGRALASAGDVNWDNYADFLIGAPLWDGPGGQDEGAVFVFYGSNNGPSGVPGATLLGGLAAAHFGAALSTAGDVDGDRYADVIVGAPDYAGREIGQGAAFVYLGSPSGITASPVFTVLGSGLNAHLGAAVSGAGDVNADAFADIVVGVPGATVGLHVAAGKALIYRGIAGGIGTALGTILGDADSMSTGSSVANAGDTNGDGYADVVIGSPGSAASLERRSGQADIYKGTASGFSSTPILTVLGTGAEERLGSTVACAGDVDGDGYADVLIGSERFPAPDVETGQFLLVSGARTGPVVESTLRGSEVGAGYAASIATTGDANGDGYAEILVGAPTFTGAGPSAQGAVFSYVGSASPPVLAGNTPLVASAPFTGYGTSLAILPWTESDPFPALLIGESLFGASQQGRAELRHAELGSIEAIPSHVYTGVGSTENLGAAVADAGDVNRDQWTDFLISSRGYTAAGNGAAGKVRLYLGGSAGPTVSPWVAEGDQVAEELGSSISGRGDVNGDGYHDVLVAAPAWDSPTAVDCGKVWFYPGGPSGLGAPAWSRSGATTGERFGQNVAMVGDLDADGYSDFAVGVQPASGSGRVEVYFGGPSGPSAAPAWTLVSSPPRSTFALPAGAGDFNGDGVSDLIVSSYSTNSDPKGMVFLYLGSRGRVAPARPYWTYVGLPNARTGAVAGGGDLNGDGLADVVVGEPGLSNGQADEGGLRIFFGRPTIQPTPDLTLESDIVGANLGDGIAPLADLNHDGFADVAAGAVGSGAIGSPGRVFVYFGGGEGAPWQVRQTEANLPLTDRWSPALLDHTGQFGFSLALRSPAGRARVSGEVEVKLQGTPFTGVANRSASLVTDTGTPSGAGSQVVSYDGQLAPFIATTSRWRARLSSFSPYFPRSRWTSLEARVGGEYDFRTGGTSTDVFGGVQASTHIERVLPNPARATSTVSFTLPARASALLDIHDLAGRHVRRLAREEFPAGRSAREWDGADDSGRRVSAGIYFVTLRVGSVVDHARILRLP